MSKRLLSFLIVCCSVSLVKAQLTITPQSNAQALAQKLVGDGVTISNVTLIADSRSTGFFNNISGTNIGIDSGIVLTNGRAKTQGGFGLDGNGTTQAYTTGSGSGALANLDLNRSGDADLNAITTAPTSDATVLEFDFLPLGDSIKFRYVFSSEEYPDYACDQFNDAFAFFISGPGFPITKNIALVPGTTDPVTIDNINNIFGCGVYPQYYVSNKTNRLFTHNGHTTVFSALARVQPCQTYHLKLVIADVGDGEYDSGVFLEAKSLSSNVYTLQNVSQSDPNGNSYLVEGCVPGGVKIKRPNPEPFPETVFIAYGGTANYMTDLVNAQTSVTIPANQTEVTLTIVPAIDNIAEGIEQLKVYTVSGCNTAIRTDSTTLQIRDYDILQLSPGMAPDTAFICRNSSQVLSASTGYTQYLWDFNPELSDINSRTPVATPTGNISKYFCTATVGTCNARDSINLKWKDVNLVSKSDVNCAGAATGQIKIAAGLSNEWLAPLEFWYGNNAHQADSTFNNLPAGTYSVKIKDASGCIDSISVTLVQAFPDLTASISSVDPSCLGGSDGSLTVIASGGKPSYLYSLDGGPDQSSGTFSAGTGPHTIKITDVNGCLLTQTRTLNFVNTVTLAPPAPVVICEGTSTTLQAVSNAQSFQWMPAGSLQNANVNPVIASPTTTTKYYVTAITGICSKTDSVIVTVNPAPVADAGSDLSICYGGDTQLHGSGGTEFIWSPATNLSATNIADPLVIRSLQTIEYRLTVKDAEGCSSLKPDTILVTVTPSVRINAGRDTAIAIGQPLQLNAVEVSNASVQSYTWTPSFGLSDPNISNPVAVLDRDITYTVTGKTADNCEGSDQINIKVYKGPEIYVPSTFTPNGDGRNDVLRALAFGMKAYHYFRVFNRYGQTIFNTSDFARGWDGKIKGADQTIGTFIWIAEAVDYKGNIVQRKGTVVLLR